MAKITRTIESSISKYLKKKIIIVTGPRQVGKTTLSQNIINNYEYLNFDSIDDRSVLNKQSWDRKKDLLVFDEIHKMKNWKSWLKGIYDKEKNSPPIIVTGSARLDIAKKMGDSLAGRYFVYNLLPLDLKELKSFSTPEKNYERLMKFSGFPEPFFESSEEFYGKWKKTHLDVIIKQDLIELESVRDIASIETLIALLQERVGSIISTASLARDLHKDIKTIQKWLVLLENLYVIFRITPYSKNIARSLLKEPKYYFYDIARVKGDEGAKLENLVALSLKKELFYLQDCHGKDIAFHFLRTKDGAEIDFFVKIDNNIPYLIEVKLSDSNPSPHFKVFEKYLIKTNRVQLVKNMGRESTYPNGLEIRNAVQWLVSMNLSK